MRPLDTFEPRQIPGTIGARSPFWNPDSSAIAYFHERRLKTVSVNGGPPFTVTTGGPPHTFHSNRGGTWGRNDVIVFGPFKDGSLYRVSAKGGTPQRVTLLKPGDRTHR